MRRSRRSLWFLLAVMAFSLGLVRLTTESRRPIDRPLPAADAVTTPADSSRAAQRPRPPRFWQKECLAFCQTLANGPRKLACRCQWLGQITRRPVADFVRSLVADASCGQNTDQACQIAPKVTATDAAAGRAAVSLIVVIRCEEHSLPYRTGWSGCDAYAFGCDHLGGPIADSVTHRSRLRRALLNRVTRLVTWADQLAEQASCALQRSPQTPDWLARTPR